MPTPPLRLAKGVSTIFLPECCPVLTRKTLALMAMAIAACGLSSALSYWLLTGKRARAA